MLEHHAFVLHSGGVDSSTALGMAIKQYGSKNVTSVSVDYGQRHKKEMEYAQKQCDELGCAHMDVLMASPPKSLLTDSTRELPNSSYADLPKGISPTYVPFRNGQLLSRIAGIAQGWVMEVPDYREASIWFGAHADDAARDAYPDCTPEFIGAMASAIYIGTYFKVRLITPFTHMEKSSIVEIGYWKAGVNYANTWSCYGGQEHHCGTCPTCRARKQAFTDSSVYDPTIYSDGSFITEPSAYVAPQARFAVEEADDIPF